MMLEQGANLEVRRGRPLSRPQAEVERAGAPLSRVCWEADAGGVTPGFCEGPSHAHARWLQRRDDTSAHTRASLADCAGVARRLDPLAPLCSSQNKSVNGGASCQTKSSRHLKHVVSRGKHVVHDEDSLTGDTRAIGYLKC